MWQLSKMSTDFRKYDFNKKKSMQNVSILEKKSLRFLFLKKIIRLINFRVLNSDDINKKKTFSNAILSYPSQENQL